MRAFKYTKANSVATALKQISSNTNARYLSGGTNILDLMKEDVERPDELIDISRLDLTAVSLISNGPLKGGISIGASGKNTETANHPLIRIQQPLLSQAILAGASAQIRNMASNGGNLLQRTRCPYFYEVSMPCNKREPGTGCAALEGFNRMHAIFGWSAQCVAVHPSDMAVALAALEATVTVSNPAEEIKIIPFQDFHRLPDKNPEKDHNLQHGDLITAIEIPKNNFATHSYYLKVRDRASYAFALVSVAAALELQGTKIVKARIALGGVAHKPWRAVQAERSLEGKTASVEVFRKAAEAEMKQAKPLEYNKFKIELGTRAIMRAVQKAFEGSIA
jgi:xanthine dehydrogenase YagS FAD-binding subunit